MFRNKSGRTPVAALIVASVALIAALAGTATAQRASVGTGDIKRNAVTSPKIAGQAVKGAKIAPGSVKTAKIAQQAVGAGKIAPEAVRGNKVEDGTLGVAKLADSALIRPEPVAASDGDEASAQPVELFVKGALTIYGKCWTDGGETHATIYAATTEDGSILSSGGSSLAGGPFLDVATDEADRRIADASALADATGDGRSTYHAATPSGDSLQGQVAAYAKNGDVAGSGIYGDGNACLFSGDVQG